MTPQHFLEKHPIPWTIIDRRQPVSPGEEGPIALESWQVQDSNGDPVIVTCTPSDGVECLVDFINAVGGRLPRLIQLDVQEKMRDVCEMSWGNMELSDSEKQHIADSAKRNFRSVRNMEKLKGIFGDLDTDGGDVRALVDFVNLIGEEYEPQHGWDTYSPHLP